jgi:hypothetical protein
MDIYRYIAENENTRLTFYFTYEVHRDELLQRLTHAHGNAVHVYDIFPQPHTETVVLEEPLSIITESGKEMFLPPGFEVNFFDRVFVLFGDTEDDE